MATITTRSLVRRYFLAYRKVFLVGGFLLILTNVAGLTIPWLLKLAVESLKTVDQAGLAAVGNFSLLIVAAALFQTLMRIASRLLIFGAGRDIEFDLRNELLAHLSSLPPSYYAGQSTGDIISRASNDMGNIRLLFGPAYLNVVNTAFVVLSALIMMLIIDVRLTLLALLPIPIMLLLVRKIAGELSRKFLAVQEHLGALSGHIQEVFSGVSVVKAFAREPWAVASFERVNEDNFGRNLSLAKTRGLMMPMMGIIGGLGSLIILVFGGYAVIDGSITLGDFVAFNGYLGMLVWPMLALGWVYTMIQRGTAAAQRLNEVLNTRATIREEKAPLPLPAGTGELDFRHVSSCYQTHDGETRKALDDIHIRLEGGGTIGITGPVGSGKSTLLRTLPRLQEISSGQVMLDGVSIQKTSLHDLRSSIAYVPQEAFLFSMSIRDNVLFGRPDASTADFDNAVRMAGLAKDSEQFSEGFDTIVGERGVTLSGGQRQRVALARALIRRPRILLLDDALSAVDAQTEEEILEHLTKFMRERTSLVVTHRLSSIRHADRILVLDHAKLVETGPHDELLKKKGLYAKLWQRQQLAKQLEAY